MNVMYADISSAEAYALTFEKVASARSFEYENKTVLAVITSPIYLKSERDALRRELEITIAEQIGKEVLVTFDTEVYRKIRGELDDSQKQALMNKARQR